MSNPLAPLKGEGLPPIGRPVSYNSTGFNPYSENTGHNGSAPGDKDIPDLKYEILEMDYRNRMLGLASLGQGIALTGGALVQSWREEETRRSK